MKIFRVILIEILIAVFLFVLAESAAHLYFYVKNGHTFGESFLYDNDPDLIYKINEHYKGDHGKYYMGMREDSFEKQKDDRLRIICLGASTTFGHKQMDNEKVWPAILEKLIGREKCEVLNSGVAGYGSSNLKARLKKDIIGLKPDIVIIFTGWNLAGSLRSQYAWVPDNIYHPSQPFLKRLNNFLIDKSIIYLKLSGFMVNKIKEEKKGTIDRIYREELPVIAEDLEEMISICRENNIIPAIIKYPSKDYSHKRYRETVEAIEEKALENNAYLIDCSSFFESLPPEERKEYFSDIAHFSDKGNRKMAEIIYNSLKDNGYVD